VFKSFFPSTTVTELRCWGACLLFSVALSSEITLNNPMFYMSHLNFVGSTKRDHLHGKTKHAHVSLVGRSAIVDLPFTPYVTIHNQPPHKHLASVLLKLYRFQF
jgi:hypothetical protein